MEDREGASFGKKLLKLGMIAGGAAVAVAAAKAGLLSDRPEDYQMPTGKANAMEVEHEPNKYSGKPVVKGAAIDREGNIIEISGLAVNPNREVFEQGYEISSDAPILAFESPDRNSKPIPVSALQPFGIDIHHPTYADPVYGEVYGDRNDPNNVLGNAKVDTAGTRAGEYWKVKGKDAQGHETTAYMDAASVHVVSEKPIIKLSVGN